MENSSRTSVYVGSELETPNGSGSLRLKPQRSFTLPFVMTDEDIERWARKLRRKYGIANPIANDDEENEKTN